MKAARVLVVVLLAAALAQFPSPVRGVWFNLPKSEPKCVSEDLHTNAVVIGDYYAFLGGDYNENITTGMPTVNVKVVSPLGKVLHQENKAFHGQFSFTTSETGNYMACFTLDSDTGGKTVTVGIDWKTGIAAKDWDSTAKKENIQGLELELKKLEETVDAVHNNLYRMIEREMEMRVVADKTNARVARYSEMSLAMCIVGSIVQILYLRRYFRKKKLI